MSKSPAKKQKTVNFSRDEPRITDPRFANIQSDPRFRLPGRKNKVKLDKRFSRVLDDEDFTKRAKVDRYGRPLKNDAERTRLKRKYDFDEDEEQDVPDHSDDDQPDDDDEVQRELKRLDSSRDLLRQGRDSDSSSVTSDETSSSDEDDDEMDDVADDEPTIGPASQSEIPMGEVTSRIAIVNLDWDNIRAADIMAVINSFLPASGSLLKVSIYPSEFGKERLEREEMEGPPREIFATKDDGVDDSKSENSDQDDDSHAEAEIKDSLLAPDTGAEFDSAALRKYQLDRLRYYYCVLTFSSPSVAEHVYSAVDGTEYLTTANFFDLRFVPDETDFSSDTPKEECTTIPDDYRPNDFVTDALQHSKVRLTWDADDGSRKETIARAFKGGRKEIDENDLKAYLASDSSSDEDEQEEADGATMSKKEIERQKMRAALGLAPEPVKKASSKGDKKEKAPVGDMQITFTSGFSAPMEEDGEGQSSKKNKKKNRGVFENSPEPDETTVEKYVRKERERKQRRKAKKQTGNESDDSNDSNAANDSETNDLGFDDPFFTNPSTTTAVGSAPSATEEKTASNRLRKEARLKKKQEREAEEAIERKQRAELELLMVDDHDDGEVGAGNNAASRKIRHFDMKEIERAEKLARKKGKSKKGKKGKTSAGDGGDGDGDANGDNGFKVDTSDPRFSRLFESHEYAIDPTNPRFKGTKGMRDVLEEGRRRRERREKKVDGGGEETQKEKKRDKKGAKDKGRDVEVSTLVNKIKMRSK